MALTVGAVVMTVDFVIVKFLVVVEELNAEATLVVRVGFRHVAPILHVFGLVEVVIEPQVTSVALELGGPVACGAAVVIAGLPTGREALPTIAALKHAVHCD